jgi:hypothetical protein
VFADTHLLLGTIDREALPFWLNGEIQLLFHKDRPGEIIPPFNAGFRIQGQKFYQEANYKDTFLDMGKGIMVKLFSIGELKAAPKVSGKQKDKSRQEEDLILRHKVQEREAEVDLHIQELVDDYTGFEKGEVLEFQLSYARRCLESAIASHFLKVTFIHGVGEGVLREQLKDMTGKMYEGLQIYDAPMDKYGAGAIEVRIPHNLPGM